MLLLTCVRPGSTLFPYTTLFRSRIPRAEHDARDEIRSIPPESLEELASAHPGHAHVGDDEDRKSTRLNSSHQITSYAVFCLKKIKHKGSSSRGALVLGALVGLIP